MRDGVTSVGTVTGVDAGVVVVSPCSGPWLLPVVPGPTSKATHPNPSSCTSTHAVICSVVAR